MGLTQFFDAVGGGDKLAVMKTKMEPYNEVLKRLGIEAHHSLMVCDSETDIRTAQNVGVPVIAVSFGYTDKHVSHFNPTYVGSREQTRDQAEAQTLRHPPAQLKPAGCEITPHLRQDARSTGWGNIRHAG